MASALDVLVDCADQQRRLFYNNFLGTGRVGEVVCILNSAEDTVLFERWEVNGKGIIATFVLKSEDSLIKENLGYSYRPIAEFIVDREIQNRKRHARLMDILKLENMSVDEAKKRAEKAGQNPSMFDYQPVTREDIEDRLPPGKKTIQGDRSTTIMVCERQVEIPNDMQQPRLNVYDVFTPTLITELMELTEEEHLATWLEANTIPTPAWLDLSCKLPFLRYPTTIVPTIYEFPAKEIDVERLGNLK